MYRKLSCLTMVALVLALVGSAGAQELGQGKVLFEYWFGGAIGADLDTLKADGNFPDNPAESEWRDGMDRPDWAGMDYWGARGRAFLTAPETGEYTFWIASDDDSELWLSTDADPANATQIASVEGWGGYQNWVGEGGSPGPNRQSAPVALVAGEKYYMETLMSDGTGGGHMSVGWAGPGMGADPVAIPAEHFTALIRDPEPLFMASNPKPADGAVDVTDPLFEWSPSPSAVLHDIYFGTNPDPGAAEYKGPMPVAMYFHLEPLVPGETYYWRIDEIEATGALRTGAVWSFSVMPLEAHFPSPADGAQEVDAAPTASWTAGQGAVSQVVYFGADEALVAAGDASVLAAEQAETTLALADLDGFATYYWRVDQVDAAGTVAAGPVWSFSTVNYVPVATALTLDYDNSVDPFVSAAVIDTPGDWTANGVSDLFIRFQGAEGMVGGFTVDEPNGIYEVSGAGNDIWGNSDQFQYVYKTLNGDATMVARVTSNGEGSNQWAKGGVMIRASLAGGSTHAFMPITAGGGNGASFQRRIEADLASSNNDSGDVVAPPYWVKLERAGDDFSGYISADGEAWTQLGEAVTIAMADPVYIGLAVTSHQSGEVRTFTFDSVSSTGDVTGEFETEQIGIAYNTPQPIYAAVEDAAGMVGVVSHPDPEATMITSSWSWKVPLSEFADAGVDLANVASVYLGAGDLINPTPDGKGTVTFEDVRVVLPVVILGHNDVTGPLDNVQGVPNDGDWPGAEYPALAVDDNVSTKFLHFKGEEQPTGFQIEPMAGATLVTGVAFTTANDAVERDPTTFELYGSNESLDGPFELIATGDIADFAGEAAWPRFTRTKTRIDFENETMYKFYQVLFPTVRDAASANSMQIAEVELLSGLGSNIIWVTGGYDDNADGAPDDQPWVDVLTAQMHAVDYKLDRSWRTMDQDKIDTLNAADLVIVSRNSNSGDYDDADEIAQWNSVTSPLIQMSSHIARSSRWKFFDTTSINNAAPMMQAVDPNDPLFAGVPLDENGQVVAMTEKNSSFMSVADAGNGTVLATRADNGEVWIAMWDAGVEYYAGAGQIAGGPRVFFTGGTQEVTPEIGRGEYNLTPEGEMVFLNLVDMLLQ